jgi:hypothetical protein
LPIDTKPLRGWFPERIPTFGPFSNLLNSDAEQWLKRFELELSKKDINYIYLKITPFSAQDRWEFRRAQLVLFTKNYLPARWWMELPNGDEVTLNVADIDTSVKLKPSHFLAPEVPPGWKTERIQRPDEDKPKDSPGKKGPDLKDGWPPTKP